MKKQNLAVTVSEKYRIPLKPELSSGLWIDRIGSGINFKNTSNMVLRVLGLYAVVGVKEGEGKFYSPETGEINISENDAILLFPQTKHYYHPDYSWETKWIVWAGEEAERLIQMKYFSPSAPVIKNGYSAISHAYTQFETLIKEETPTAILERKVTLFNMLLKLHKNSHGIDSQNKTAVKKAINYIDTNITHDLTLEEVALQSGYSIPHFRRIFNTETGVSPKEFIISRKISKAKEYLFSRIPIKEAAEMLGFNDEFYFRKVFKKVTGVTPGKFQ
jgi:AraC-like DNA-binding protein